MTRNHRAAHRFVWPALGFIVAAGLIAALGLRAPVLPDPSAPSVAETKR